MRYVTWLGAVLGAVLANAALNGCGGGDGGSGGGSGLNGCDASSAEDHTADSAVTIETVGLSYSPACIKVKTGAKVTFNSDFTEHPLRGGTVTDNGKTPDSSSPIKAQDAGTTVTFTFSSKGDFGFYCDVHGLNGMAGAVFVQ